MGTPPIQIASLGMWDSLILMVMALVVFGPRRLPEIGRQIGKLMYEFRKASNDFKFQMEEELRTAEEADRRKKEEERMRALATTAAPLTIDGGATASASDTASAGADSPLIPASTEVEPDAPAAAADENYPRIMPPSTGEQIPASRPNRFSSSTVADHDTEAKPEAELTSDPIHHEPAAADEEQAANHG
jgi:sec-independent protein translocase protein TatB